MDLRIKQLMNRRYQLGSVVKSLHNFFLSFGTVVIASNTQFSNTGNTNENTAYQNVLPADSIGANGRIRVRIHGTVTNNANNKTLRVKLGGVTLLTLSYTTVGTFDAEFDLINRNSKTAQIMYTRRTSIAGTTFASEAGPSTFTLNTSGAMTFQVTVQNDNAADNISVNAVLVEIKRAA